MVWLHQSAATTLRAYASGGQVVHVLYIVGHIVSMHVNVPRAGVHLCGTLHCTRLHMHEPSNKAAISECNQCEQTSVQFCESFIKIK